MSSEQRLLRAESVCRELRHLLVTDGKVVKYNSESLRQLLSAWMELAGPEKLVRPGGDNGVMKSVSHHENEEMIRERLR